MSTKGEVLLGSLFLCSTTTGCLTATRFFVNNLSCAASLGHSCIGRERFWKGLAINKWCRLGCITFDKQKECSFLSFQSELCAWRCISWICWVMHSLHLYIGVNSLSQGCRNHFLLPFIRRLGAPGDQQKSLQLQPQLSLQLDRCSLSSN